MVRNSNVFVRRFNPISSTSAVRRLSGAGSSSKRASRAGAELLLLKAFSDLVNFLNGTAAVTGVASTLYAVSTFKSVLAFFKDRINFAVAFDAVESMAVILCTKASGSEAVPKSATASFSALPMR